MAAGDIPPLLFPRRCMIRMSRSALSVRVSTCSWKESLELILIPRVVVEARGLSLNSMQVSFWGSHERCFSRAILSRPRSTSLVMR